MFVWLDSKIQQFPIQGNQGSRTVSKPANYSAVKMMFMEECVVQGGKMKFKCLGITAEPY